MKRAIRTLAQQQKTLRRVEVFVELVLLEQDFFQNLVDARLRFFYQNAQGGLVAVNQAPRGVTRHQNGRLFLVPRLVIPAPSSQKVYALPRS